MNFWQIRELTEGALIRLLQNAAVPTPGLGTKLTCLNLADIPKRLLTNSVLKVVYQQYNSMDTLKELLCNMTDCKNFLYYCSGMFPRLTRLTIDDCPNESSMLDILGACTELKYLCLRRSTPSQFWLHLAKHASALQVFLNLDTLEITEQNARDDMSYLNKILSSPENKLRRFSYTSSCMSLVDGVALHEFIVQCLVMNLDSLVLDIPYVCAPYDAHLSTSRDVLEKAIIPNSLRTTELKLHFNNFYENLSMVLAAVLKSSKQLTSLCYSSRYPDFTKDLLNDMRVAQLQQLSISQCLLPTLPSATFAQLRSLTLSGMDSIKESKLLELLDLCPVLLNLTVINTSFEADMDDVDMPGTKLKLSHVQFLGSSPIILHLLLGIMSKAADTLTRLDIDCGIISLTAFQGQKTKMKALKTLTCKLFATAKTLFEHLECPNLSSVDFGKQTIELDYSSGLVHFPSGALLVAEQFHCNQADIAMLNRIHKCRIRLSSFTFSSNVTQQELFRLPTEVLQDVERLDVFSIAITDLQQLSLFLQRANKLRMLKMKITHGSCDYAELLNVIRTNCPSLEDVTIGGKGTCTVEQFSEFALSLKNLRVLMTDCCPYKSQEQIEELKAKIRRDGRSAPKLMISFMTTRSVREESSGGCLVQ